MSLGVGEKGVEGKQLPYHCMNTIRMGLSGFVKCSGVLRKNIFLGVRWGLGYLRTSRLLDRCSAT
jgi:hypothetical protein